MRAAMVHAEGCGRRKGQGRCSRAGAALDRLDLAALAQLGVALAAAAQCVENGDALLAPAIELPRPRGYRLSIMGHVWLWREIVLMREKRRFDH